MDAKVRIRVVEPYSTARELDRWLMSRSLDSTPERPDEPESTVFSTPTAHKIDEREEEDSE